MDALHLLMFVFSNLLSIFNWGKSHTFPEHTHSPANVCFVLHSQEYMGALQSLLWAFYATAFPFKCFSKPLLLLLTQADSTLNNNH